MNSNVLKVALLLVLGACAQNSTYTPEYFQRQAQISDLAQQGMYYYWNGGDYKKAEKDFFKGITLKGNMEAVEKFFLQAVELDSNRLDLQYSLASTYILQKKFEDGFKVYDRILSINPKEINAAILYAMYAQAQNKTDIYNKYLAIAQKIDAKKAQAYADSVPLIEQYNQTKFNVSPEKKYESQEHAIVILGYALAEDGSMQETLIKRLEQGLALANVYPESKIIVTGAVPKQGNTEAGLMKAWFRTKGVSADRVIIEDRAKDTVANAFYSIDILKTLPNIKYVTVLSSASHMRRALNVFSAMGKFKNFTPEWDNFVYLDYKSLDEAHQVTDAERIVIYRDFLRASGIWAYPGWQQ